MTIKDESFPKMEDLASFLCKTAQKRTDYLNRRCRDLRIEAVLEATLKKTQYELDNRQKMRKRKWCSVKQEWLAKNGLCDNPKRRKSIDYEWSPNENGQWGVTNKVITEDLFNLKDFFNDLNAVYKGISVS